jgi:hypothetical protein
MRGYVGHITDLEFIERREVLLLPRIKPWSSSPCYFGEGIDERKAGIKMTERKRGR